MAGGGALGVASMIWIEDNHMRPSCALFPFISYFGSFVEIYAYACYMFIYRAVRRLVPAYSSVSRPGVFGMVKECDPVAQKKRGVPIDPDGH